MAQTEYDMSSEAEVFPLMRRFVVTDANAWLVATHPTGPWTHITVTFQGSAGYFTTDVSGEVGATADAVDTDDALDTGNPAGAGTGHHYAEIAQDDPTEIAMPKPYRQTKFAVAVAGAGTYCAVCYEVKR